MEALRLESVADRVVAWHNRHPLAQRIGREQVHSVGYVALPFEGGPAPAADTAAPPSSTPPPGLRAAFDADFIAPLPAARVARFALRHGRCLSEPPGGARLRELARAAHQAASTPVYVLTAAIEVGSERLRVLLGAGDPAPVLGSRLFSRPRQLGAVAAAVLAFGVPLALLAATVLRTDPAAPAPGSRFAAGKVARAVTVASAATSASAASAPLMPAPQSPPAPVAATPTAGASAPLQLAAAEPAASAAGAVHAPAAEPVAVAAAGSIPARPATAGSGAEPLAAPVAAAASAPRRHRADAVENLAGASPRLAPALGQISDADKEAARETRAALVAAGRLGARREARPAVKAGLEAKADPADAPKLPEPAAPAAPSMATGTKPAAAVREASGVVPAAAGGHAEAATVATSHPPPAASARTLAAPVEPRPVVVRTAKATGAAPARPADPGPPAAPAFAVSTRALRTRAEAEQVMAAMAALLARPGAEMHTEILPQGDDWRVASWPFARSDEAERARALLAARGMRVQVVAF